MRTSTKRALPVLLCLLAAPALAASPRWSLLGPNGGAAALVAVAPSNANVVYATGMDQEGIFRSLDRGMTWSWPERETLAPELSASVLAVDPRQPGTVYLGDRRFGLTRSTDGGVTWSAFQSFGLASPGVWDVKIDPNRPNIVFAAVSGSPGGGVFRSRDGGATWSRKTAGLPSPAPALALAIDPQRPNVILAALAPNGLSLRIYRSTDGGETWKGTSFPAHVGVIGLAFSGGRSGLAYALSFSGLRKSADGGVSWSPVALPSGPVYTALAIDPRDPRTLLVGTEATGIFRSRNAGASWSPAVTGLTSSGVHDLAYNPQGTAVYAATDAGIYQSAGGQSWTRTIQGYATARTKAVALSPGNPPVLWALSPDVGIYRSLNGGGVWRRVPIPGLGSFFQGDVVADPDHPGTVWVQASNSLTGPHKTIDGGRTWSALPVTGPFSGLVRDPSDGTLLLFGSRLLRSSDGGLTWTPSSAGIAAGDVILSLAFDPASPRTLYAAGQKTPIHLELPSARLYKSADGGLTWTRSDSGLTPMAAAQKVAVAPSGVYAAVAPFLFRSTDGGAHWERVATVPQFSALGSQITDLVAAPDGTLYIATMTGVFATSDGVDWTPVSDGLADLFVHDLLLAPLDPDHLYAATANGGIAVLPLNE